MTRNEVDLDEIVYDDWRENETEFNGRFNKTSQFVLPMIGIPIGSNLTNRYLRNAFINDDSAEHDFENSVFVLFKVKNLKEKYWLDFCKLVLTNPTYRDMYITDYYVGTDGESDLIMYVFRIPDKHIEDYKVFKNGRYSLMSDEYKKKFPRFSYVSGVKRESRMYGILNKSEDMKDDIVKRFINPQTSTPEDVLTFRKDINTWDEIWDAPQDKEERFHFKITEVHATGIPV